MQFAEPLKSGLLKKRYKRFFADVELSHGETITIHCPNTGSMRNCILPEKTVWYSTSTNKKRKLPYTWELIEPEVDQFIGINTHRANGLVREAIETGVITELQGYATIQSEVKYGHENSRIDLLLQSDAESCYVEVKNVTLKEGEGAGYFPDAVTTRGQKHLRELMAMKQQGHRAVILFCVQHSGITTVAPADHIDAEYGKMFRQALKEGVEALAYQAELSPQGITLKHQLPIIT